MKNSKKGFTLTEILIVTAIIVIISGAAIAGIAVTIKNAKERGEYIQGKQGVNWESEAVLKVKNTKIELGNEQIYEESADTPAPTAGASSDTEEMDDGSSTGGDSTGTDSGTGSDSTGGSTGDSGSATGGSSSGDTGDATGGNSGSTTSGGSTTTASSSTGGTSASVSTSTSTGKRWNPSVGPWGSNTATTTANVSLAASCNTQITNCTITVEEGDIWSWSFNNWKYDCQKIDDNTFEISYKLTGDNATYNPPDTTLSGFSITYDSDTEGKLTVSVD